MASETIAALSYTAMDAYNPNPYGEIHMLHVESVQELARDLPPEIPHRYIRPHHERPSPSLLPHSSIPVFDMAKLLAHSDQEERQHEMHLLSKVCQEWGFFQVVNHGIPRSLIDRIRGVAKEFFDLPLQEKQKCAPQAGDVQGYGKTFVVEEDQKLDWGDLLALAIMPANMRNFTLWPTIPCDFRETVMKYGEEVERVAQVLLNLLAENLHLEADYFKEKFGEEPMTLMRMNLYPPCPRPDLVVGLSPHSDGGGITLLLQDDDVQGLHVRNKQQWIPVDAIPYALVVNIGDLVEVMSNGRYKSVEHRAVTNEEKTRMSIALFYNPGKDAEVGPAEKLVNEEHPALYRSFIHSDYIRYYLSKQLNGKHPLADFAKIGLDQ